MKLMKKNRLGTSLLSIALAFSAKGFASDITVHNNDFDALALEDGKSAEIVHNWEVTSGLAGIHNPTSHIFVGEGGAGIHDNTLYMIDNSTVSQTLTFKALEFSAYDLSFDVGQRNDVPAQNYSIKVTAGNKTMLWATNPDLPTTPGSFKHVDLQFSTDGLPDDYITVEIETQGTGHLHFDNFDMSFQQKAETQTEYFRSVAHYMLTTNKQTGEQACVPQSSLNDANGNAYMNQWCECINSKVAWTGRKTSFDDVLEKRFYHCITESSN